MQNDDSTPFESRDMPSPDSEVLHRDGDEAMATDQSAFSSNSPLAPSENSRNSQHYVLYAGSFAIEADTDRAGHSTADGWDLDFPDHRLNISSIGTTESVEEERDFASSEEEHAGTAQSSVVAEAGSTSSIEESVEPDHPSRWTSPRRVAYYVLQYQNGRRPRACLAVDCPSDTLSDQQTLVDGFTLLYPQDTTSNLRTSISGRQSDSASAAESGGCCRDDAGKTE